MRYKVTMQISEEELAKLYNYDRITPIYQDVPPVQRMGEETVKNCFSR